MQRGGNAVDAVIAADAVLGMVLPSTCGIGGDLFAIVHRPGWDKPEVLNASGRGGSGLDASRLRSAGHTVFPYRAPESVTVPGCVDGWEALAARHGSRPLAELLAPAIALGTEGFPVSAEFASDLRVMAPMIQGQRSAESLYPGGTVPVVGDILTRTDLAATLSAIATEGRGAFYEGRVAEQISAATGGVLVPGDLAANTSDWVEAIGATAFGLKAWTVPPNSQGYLTVAAAMLLEHLDPPANPMDPAFHHAVIEAYRAVAWERDDLVADSRFAPLSPESLLDPERILSRLKAISPERVTAWKSPKPAPGGTAYFCAMDASGMAVSCTSDGSDGWVSLEVSPLLANDTAGTIQAAARLHERAARPNLFIKIPGTPEGIPAIEQSIFDGVPINVTLLFSKEHCAAAAQAYLRGIERRLKAGLGPRVESVASLFVSRWDAVVKEDVQPQLHNRLGVAIAMRTYKAYCDLLASERWQRLAAAGARPQRLLWASTGTKDPAAPDTLYVEALAAAETIDTIPEKTLLAFADHGKVGATLPADGGYAQAVLDEFKREGVDDEALAARLQREGVQAFAKSWGGLMARIREKSSQPTASAARTGTA